jgi:4'-phosphopantetheinyl transferase
MAGLGWLTRELAEVPPGDEWLSAREQQALSALSLPKRCAEWRLGRWTAKAAVAARLGAEIDLVEVLAEEDGSPAVHLEGARAPLALSLSHRKGRALVTLGEPSSAVGCDLEAIEPRSPAFTREWLDPAERDLLAGLDRGRAEMAANLFWTAKEAASKARRGGLRLNVRRARAEPLSLEQPPGTWAALRVTWEDGSSERGWWRWEPGWVMSILSEPAVETLPEPIRAPEPDKGRRTP